ncbi:hypothetical protein ALC56_08365 [Trachymyrmex septentrionalis]|uniref:Uncharacterized protein n=1 Tax=Trachymyrmex septentrionalis TaxID=34720 RepID=A0A195FAS0_9HYME|nr:hypothetical protein ALC56_08365 [Trachymyrmex septentrionalis]
MKKNREIAWSAARGHDESRNEIFERRRTDVGRCFYERQAVCVDVNYIGGHGEQIAVFLLYNNNGDPFSKAVISPDSVCKVLKGGAVFYRHDLRRERTVKVLSRGEDVDGDRDFTYEEVYGLSTGSAAGGS